MLRLAFLSLLLAPPAQAEEVTVFAAASLKTALDAVAADFQAETGHTVTISYAGSNQLAQQIIQGAPADIFLSAAVNWMDAVGKAGHVNTRADLWGNSLVLIAHGKDVPPLALTDLAASLGDEKLAMALVDSVPAGQYGKAALESLGLWETVAPSVAQSDNVRAALALVSTGEAPFGIVYATDAHADDHVTVVATFPESTHPAITYPAALLTSAADAADQAFYKALSSDKADAIFTMQGFRDLN
jgi:molybdate transport system substrate-binding protein